MEIAGIYGRSSLGKGKQGDTVEHQVDMIKEFAKRTNIKAIFDDKFIYEDDGESGFKTTLLQRPSMRRLLNDIDKGLVQIVFFKGVSRFARDSGECITTVKRLINKGIRVISLEENYDSLRDDPTLFQIFAVLAENESRKTSIRVSLGNKQKARNGLWSGTTTPLGYSKVKDLPDEELQKLLTNQGKHGHSLYPNEHAQTIQKIFNMYTKENLGRKKITSYLNDNGYKTDRGKLFQEKHIIDILQNEAYIGNIVYGKTRYNYVEDEEKQKKIQQVVHLDEKDWVRKENAHPAIIEKELFEQAQKKIKENTQLFAHPRKFNAAKHPLTGLLKCGLCNAPMICQKRTNKRKDGTKIEYRYYVCSTYHKQGRNVCPQANVNADYLEEDVLEVVEKEFKQLIDYSNTNGVKKKEGRRKEYQTEIQQIESALKKKMNASKTLLETRQYYDIETFVELNAELQEDIKKLREQKGKLEDVINNLNKDDNHIEISEIVKEIKENKLMNIDQKRKLFHRALESVVFQGDVVKEINFNKSLSL